MNNCIIQVGFPNNEKFARMYHLSKRSVEWYADRWGFDYFNVTEKKYSLERPEVPHLEKLWVQDYLGKYDRVMFLDSDILINPMSPNIFKLYPEDKIYGMTEGHFPWTQEDVRFFENRYDMKFPVDEDGDPVLLNGGVIIYGQASKKLFEAFDLKNFTRSFGNTRGEQSYINTLMHMQKLAYGFIESRWNHIIYARYEGQGADAYATRRDSFFIHYTNNAFYPDLPDRFATMEEDFKLFGYKE